MRPVPLQSEIGIGTEAVCLQLLRNERSHLTLMQSRSILFVIFVVASAAPREREMRTPVMEARRMSRHARKRPRRLSP
jgi:hypothetical protein